MAITGIVAVARNFAIGKAGRLPWHYPADLKFFKQTTLNQTIVMGWNTWASIGEPLPKRLNVVLSRSKNIEHQPSLLVLRNREEVLALNGYLKGDVFLIGGAETYRAFGDAVEQWIVTEIPARVEDADAFMPTDFLDGFRVKEEKLLEDELTVKFYKRK